LKLENFLSETADFGARFFPRSMKRRGKWFSGTENVLRYSKHNLPFANANEIPQAGLGVSPVDFVLALLTFVLAGMTLTDGETVVKTQLVICRCK
jgi:hypothetical protein